MKIYEECMIILPSKKSHVNQNLKSFQQTFQAQSTKNKNWTWQEVKWDVNNPEASEDLLKEEIKNAKSVILTIKHAHQKAIETAKNISKKHGLFPYIIESKEEIKTIEIIPMPFDKRHETNGIDFIGDVHGCAKELLMLLDRLGYMKEGWSFKDEADYLPYIQKHPEGRKTLLLGDITDRGPYNLASLLIAQRLDEIGMLRVLGNHDEKCARVLQGANIRLPKGLQKTISEISKIPYKEAIKLGEWLGDAQTQLILDEGRVIAAHAGLDSENQGKNTGKSRSFALYGLGTNDGRKDENGYPIRIDWAQDYKSDVVVVHGHIVHKHVREINNVISIDTGCVFGGKLTAYRWPQKEIVQVDALKTYWGENRLRGHYK